MDRELFNQQGNMEFRRHLRNELTEAEKCLWYQLRSRRLDGWKFRRQHGIGSYIVDFYCPKAKLVIEIDGGTHFEPGAMEKDNRRESYLNENGLRVLRFTNTEVHEALEFVLGTIRLNLS